MANAPYVGSTKTTPPPKKHDSVAQALAEHIAQNSGQTPTQVLGSGPERERGIQPGQDYQTLASYGAYPNYFRAGQGLDAYLQSVGSPLFGKGKVFAKKAKKFGIDPKLLLAIAGAETSFMKDPNAAPWAEHNAFGMGPGIAYDSWGQGIGAAAKNLSENYFGEGLNTIEEISSKWAPVGAANDPNHVNENWSGNVGDFYKDIAGKAMAVPSAAPKLKGLQELIYDPIGSYFRGNDGVVHQAATNPRILLKSLRVGQNRFNLDPNENPYTGEVYPVHAGTSAEYGDSSGSGDPSFHYQTFPGKFGPDHKKLGEAIDWNGSPEDMAAFFRWAANKFVGPGDYNYGTAPESGVAGVAPTPAQQQEQANAAQMVSAAGDSAAAPGFREMTPFSRRKRKSKGNDIVEQLIQSMLNSQAGAGMQQQYT